MGAIPQLNSITTAQLPRTGQEQQGGRGRKALLGRKLEAWASFTEDMNRNNSLEITRGYQIPKEREVVSGKRRATWKGPEAGECAVC